MRCKNCGAEIPSNARYCDVCGQKNYTVVKRQQRLVRAKQRQYQRQKNAKKVKKGCLIALGVFVCFIVFLLIVGFIASRKAIYEYEQWESARDLSDWDVKVSAEEYEQLQVGMTYAEIREIVGGEGKLVDDRSYYRTYAWPGEYYDDYYHGSLIVDFDKDKENSKMSDSDISESITEYDIKDGAESYETYKIVKDYQYEQLDTVVVTKAQYEKITEGMNYEQVCEVLGGPGKLYTSHSTVYAYGKYSYTTYVWKAKYKDNYTTLEIDFDDGIIKRLYDWRADYID